MSNRAARRAAERLARQAAAPAVTNVNNNTAPSKTSEAQINANRANAQLSSGPTSPTGKSISSLNAVKTGLTGRTVLLPSDDAEIYQQHLVRAFTQYAPATDQEKTLVQTIADTDWRLLRIAPLEAGIYAIGLRELAERYDDETNLVTRHALIHAEIFRTYKKEFHNLALQERRLRNQRKEDIAELESIQQKRLEKAEQEVGNNAAEPVKNGFVFTAAESTPPPTHPETSNQPAIAPEPLICTQEEQAQAA